jgi:outer membrane protein
MRISKLSPLFLIIGAFSTGLSRAAQPTPPPSTPPAPGVTLADCYQKALQVSETLAISEQEIRQLEAIYRQGVSAILPQISWNMTQLWQDTSEVDVSESTSGVQGTLLRERRPESYFQLQQPLFHGLRELNATKGFKAAREGAQFNRDQAALTLLSDVADVFYTSYDLQQELEVLDSQRKLIDDRLSDLQHRVEVGKSRDSEVVSVQVDRATLQAQIEETRQRWAIARQTLRFLTEVPPSVPLIETRPLPTPPTLESALAQSVNRPDLKAAEQAQKQQQYQLRYAKGGFFPNLDFTGKYYTERVGFNENVKWDALLNLEVPIFTGFRTKSEVQEARAQLITADLQYARVKRLITRDVEIAHQNLLYTAAQGASYGKAVELAQKNYQLQQREYRLGLINNLQVLDVLTDLQNVQIQKLRSDASLRANDIRLRVAMGQGLNP